MRSAKSIIVIGFLLVLTGAVLPFAMIIGFVQTNFLFSFISYGASICGLFMGIIGAANLVREREQEQQWRDFHDL